MEVKYCHIEIIWIRLIGTNDYIDWINKVYIIVECCSCFTRINS